MDTVMQIVLHITWYLGEHWKTLAAYSGWMLGICSVLQYIKRRYELDKSKGFSFLGLWRMDGPRIMSTLYLLATAGSAALSFFTNPANSIYIPNRFLFLFGVGYTIHRFIVSPTATKIENKMKPYIAALAQLKAMEEKIVANQTAKVTTVSLAQGTTSFTMSQNGPPPQVVRPTNLVQ